MRKFLTAGLGALAAIVGALVITTSPAVASNPCGDNWISAGSLGEVELCYWHEHYSPEVLQHDGGSLGVGWYVNVHDWTDNGHSIYVEYQEWGSTAWVTVPGSTDVYGGPSTESGQVINADRTAKDIRYVRVHEVGTNAISYLFRPVAGAGSGDGCGLENYAGDSPTWTTLDGYSAIACPSGSY